VRIGRMKEKKRFLFAVSLVYTIGDHGLEVEKHICWFCGFNKRCVRWFPNTKA